MGPDFFWMGGMWIFPIILVVVMIIICYLVFGRGVCNPSWLSRKSKKPLDILKERYAKGEITKEEFDQIKKDLEKK